jgi:hypothetical protein
MLPLQERKVLQERLEGRERDVLVQYGISRLGDDDTLAVCKMQVAT